MKAAVIFSRWHRENEFHNKVGVAQMQDNICATLQEIGYDVTFAGQEDSEYSDEIVNSDVIISLVGGILKLPDTCKAKKYLFMNSIHPKNKNRILFDSAQKFGMPPDDIQDENMWNIAINKSDYMLFAGNEQGIKTFTDNGIDRTKILTYNNSVDSEIWKADKKKQEIFSFVSWSNHCLRKGFPVLIDAWNEWFNGQKAGLFLLGAIHPTCLHIVKGDYNSQGYNNIWSLLTYFNSNDPKPKNAISSCHVGVLPTLEDVQPNTLLEMASCGLPIITTTNSNVSFTTDFTTYVEPNDVKSLADSFEWWYNNQDKVIEKGALARDYILKNHIWSNFKEEFTKIIKETTK